jgi:hypothetical protein
VNLQKVIFQFIFPLGLELAPCARERHVVAVNLGVTRQLRFLDELFLTNFAEKNNKIKPIFKQTYNSYNCIHVIDVSKDDIVGWSVDEKILWFHKK